MEAGRLRHEGNEIPSAQSLAASVKTLFSCLYRNLSKSGEGLAEPVLRPQEIAFLPAVEKQLPRKLLKQFCMGLKPALHDGFFDLPIRLVKTARSQTDGSTKILFALCRSQSAQSAPDQELLIESVLIPERGRLTLCVSSQVGCAQGCRFCQTGRMGLVSQLTAAEIVAQVVYANSIVLAEAGLNGQSEFAGQARVTNVVFMGMGEPLDNTDAVLSACRIMTDPWGLAIGPRKITISTVGLPEGIQRVLTESPFHIALSLHSPFDDERSRILPVNKRFPLHDVLGLMAELRRPKDCYLIQYTLIRNVNDSREHALELARVLAMLPAKINLIPLNEHNATAYRRPNFEHVSRFQTWLKSFGFVTTVRLSKGRDIDAACGQLAQTESVKKKQKLSESLHVEESLLPI